MPIASQYAILSKDKKSLLLPDEVQDWLKEVDRFLVVVENDELILRKAHTRRTLEELVTKKTPPLSPETLNEVIRESRR